MKLNELKHNHSLTDLLKILLFTIIMLAPIGMVATRCLYVIANKNAYQSYSETQITNVLNIDNSTNELLEEGQQFLFSFKNPAEQGTGNVMNITFTYTDSTVNLRDWFGTNYEIDGLGMSTDGNYSQYFRLYAHDSINDTYNSLNNGNIIRYNDEFFKTKCLPLNFICTLKTKGTNILFGFNFAKLYYTKGNLDNVFEYSVSQLEESSLFNWTENTAIFSGVQTMTTQLGITNQTIPILLVYWFLLTVIYIIIDIVLKLFTYMTHAIGNKKV